MDDLVKFLRDRYDDEQAARAATPSPWEQTPMGVGCLASDEYWAVVDCSGTPAARENAQHVARHDPARVLLEVEAKRKIVDAHGRTHECISLTGSGDTNAIDGRPWALWEPEHTADAERPCFVVRALALPYADHPNYQAAWRP